MADDRQQHQGAKDSPKLARRRRHAHVQPSRRINSPMMAAITPDPR